LETLYTSGLSASSILTIGMFKIELSFIKVLLSRRAMLGDFLIYFCISLM
jgi:hypothetical protein